MNHKAFALATFVLLAPPVFADAKKDAEMKKLALASGCMTCHSIEPAAAGAATPIGPAWQDVAKRYRGKPGAQDFLTRVVMEGSSPYASHWKDKVSGLAMPPNAVAIKDSDARTLVGWILQLESK